MALAHLTLATRNVEATARFFESTLQWQPVPRPNNINRSAAWLAIAPGQELHLVLVEDFEPSNFENEFGRHIAIHHPPEQFDSLKQRLTRHGAQLINPIRETPFQRFFFKDPNGYVFEVIESNPQPET